MARRFLIYSIGFLMGCILVYRMMIQDSERDFYSSWLPTGRVLKKVAQTLDRNSDNYKCHLRCNNIFDSDIDLILQNGDINFSESDTEGRTKRYEVKGRTEDGRELYLSVQLKDEIASILEASVDGNSCNCD